MLSFNGLVNVGRAEVKSLCVVYFFLNQSRRGLMSVWWLHLYRVIKTTSDPRALCLWSYVVLFVVSYTLCQVFIDDLKDAYLIYRVQMECAV